MKNQLPMIFIVSVLSITLLSCAKDDLDPNLTTDNLEILSIDSDHYEDEVNTFHPEVILTHCFVEGTKCSIDNPNQERYVYKWSHDGMALGHDNVTPCLCGGILDLDLTRIVDGATFSTTIELPACIDEIK